MAEERHVPIELFDWKKPFTPDQIEDIESKIDPLADNIEELAEFIEDADDFIRSDNNWIDHTVCDLEHGFIDFSGYSGYSEDSLAWAQGCMLSAKKLRSKLEKVMGVEEALEFYKRLQSALRLVIEDGCVYLFEPENRVPPEMINSGAADIAELIRAKYGNFLERQDNVFFPNGEIYGWSSLKEACRAI